MSILNITLNADYIADGGFTVLIEDSGNVLYTKIYRPGINLSWLPEKADGQNPFVRDILESLVSTYGIDHILVEDYRRRLHPKMAQWYGGQIEENERRFRHDFCEGLETR